MRLVANIVYVALNVFIVLGCVPYLLACAADRKVRRLYRWSELYGPFNGDRDALEQDDWRWS